MSNLSIGSKIRQVRESKGISIKEVSQKTNLSSSFISQAERDLVSPSIASLREIAKALNVPIFYFFDDDINGHVVRKNNRRKFSMPDSKITYELLSPDLNREMEIVLITLAKGQYTFEHPFSHEGEESACCIKGRVEVTLGLEKYTLEEGDAIYFKCDIPHRFHNVGEDEAKVLCSITPPSF